MRNEIGFFQDFFYGVDRTLDGLINKILSNCEIESVDSNDRFFYEIKLKSKKDESNVVLVYWNENRWYGFMARGHIELEGKTVYNWNYVRPRRKTMNRVLNEISKHIISLID